MRIFVALARRNGELYEERIAAEDEKAAMKVSDKKGVVFLGELGVEYLEGNQPDVNKLAERIEKEYGFKEPVQKRKSCK